MGYIILVLWAFILCQAFYEYYFILIVAWHYDPHLTGEKIKVQKSYKKIENLFKITHKVELGFKLQTINHW